MIYNGSLISSMESVLIWWIYVLNVDWLTSFYEKNPDAELAIASVYAA